MFNCFNRLWETMASLSPAGTHLAESAQEGGFVTICLPLDATTEMFDIKEAVLATLVSCLDQFGSSAKRLPAYSSKINVRLFEAALTSADPLLAVIRDLCPGKKGTLELSLLCTAFNLPVHDLVSALFSFQVLR